ncbi:MAG: hypothetical protein Q7T19_05275 [Caulobacter sp.]|nr:hypothetical protein [Caulobacter sp.]
MAGLNFSIYGNDFECGLFVLIEGLTTASEAMNAQHKMIMTECAASEEAVPNGAPRDGELDEETGAGLTTNGDGSLELTPSIAARSASMRWMRDGSAS